MSSETILKNESNNLGLQVSTYLSHESHLKILDFCHTIGIKIDENSACNFSNPKENMHATILACSDSKNHTVDSLQKVITEHEFVGKPIAWKKVGHNKNILALVFESPEMDSFHKKIQRQTGLNHNFEDFVMHVTVHYNYEGELPKELPNFSIKFKEIQAKLYTTNFKKEAQLAVETVELAVETVANNITKRMNNFKKTISDIRSNTISELSLKPRVGFNPN